MENETAVVENAAHDIGKAAEAAGNSLVEQTSSFFLWIKGMMTWDNLFKVIGTVITILIAWIVYRLIIRFVKKSTSVKMTKQKTMIINRVVKYIFYIIAIMAVLNLFGVKLSAIWGAAGIAGVAIGFAAQTSVSNIISGIFVLTEGSLKVGDVIIVDDVTGIVDTINLLSVRVHTLDNQMVRIPNSTIINTILTNNSYHKKRRLTIGVDVAYDTDLEFALETLLKAPALCSAIQQDPEPAAWFDGFGESGIHMTLAAWFKIADFITAKNQLYIAIKKVFDEAGISIPFNQLDIQIKNLENDEVLKTTAKQAVKTTPAITEAEIKGLSQTENPELAQAVAAPEAEPVENKKRASKKKSKENTVEG